MKFLAWDTSTPTAWIVGFEVPENDPLRVVDLSAYQASVDSRSSEHLLPAIDEVLRSRRWRLSDLGRLGVGHGPGSFTGLRIGLVTARTLAQALELPLVSVSSLAPYTSPGTHVVIPCTVTDVFVRAETTAGEVIEANLPSADMPAWGSETGTTLAPALFSPDRFAAHLVRAPVTSWREIRPQYLRLSAAEVKLAKGLLPPVSSRSET